ncbi:hypothetical protein VNO77_27869 [Canavalia gladiata]|uniref:Uncharacterized protein n=1 Tax=Canavalia gladiata TaxID=3824 RepID=A0AAN9Q6W8_CANGL
MARLSLQQLMQCYGAFLDCKSEIAKNTIYIEDAIELWKIFTAGDQFDTMKTQIIMKEPLPNNSKVFSQVLRQESCIGGQIRPVYYRDESYSAVFQKLVTSLQQSEKTISVMILICALSYGTPDILCSNVWKAEKDAWKEKQIKLYQIDWGRWSQDSHEKRFSSLNQISISSWRRSLKSGWWRSHPSETPPLQLQTSSNRVYDTTISTKFQHPLHVLRHRFRRFIHLLEPNLRLLAMGCGVHQLRARDPPGPNLEQNLIGSEPVSAVKVTIISQRRTSSFSSERSPSALATGFFVLSRNQNCDPSVHETVAKSVQTIGIS